MKSRHEFWACALINIVAIICWTLLAAHFGKWWIALFAAVFLCGTKTRYRRICDGCGRHSPFADSSDEALKKAAAAGWITIKNGDTLEDYCPECGKKMEG